MTADEFAKCGSHPLRLDIIKLMSTHGARSPSQLTEDLDWPLTLVSYHVRVLRSLGAIKPTQRKMVRGAVQHFYQLDRKAIEQGRRSLMELTEGLT